MSDNPSKKDDIQANSKKTGWHTPQTATIEPVVVPVVKPQTGSGWRVPALPQNLPAQPQNQGDWHLPRPEDTVFTEDSETEIPQERKEIIESRPEDFLQSLQLNDAQESTPTQSAVIAEPAADKTDSQSLLELELSGVVAATGADEDDEDDADAFSMSELMALSSLVEQSPKSTIVPKATSQTGVQPAEVTGAQPAATAADDPAAYARRQLEALQGGDKVDNDVVPVVTAADTGKLASTDPAAYAQQQLAALGATTAEPVVHATPSLSAKQQELAQKFRDTETQVRALRAQYQSGQLTRDQLQEQLKRLMILDESNTWWMMGVETDTWYRFQNNEWLVATPPYSGQAPSTAGRTPAPTVTTNLDPSIVIQGSLPYFPTGAAAPQAGGFTQPMDTNETGGFGITEELGLPRQHVPIQDPERTVVNTAGTYLSPVQMNSAPTVPNLTPYNPTTAETQVNPAYDPYGYGPATPAPIPGQAETAPDYQIEETPGQVYEDAAKLQQQRAVRTVLTVTALGIGALLLLVACGIGFVLVQYNGLAGQYQTQIAALANYRPQFQTARVLDINGNLIAELNSQDGGARTTVALSKISPFMVHAVVSLENERFFEDPGWDWVAIGRAIIQNVSAGQVESGASTITQQIAEQLILKTPTNTAALKLQELVIAAEISKQYSKEKILELYLNEIFFGNQSYGVEAASQFYFNISANDLNLPQAAMLAGMISSPVTYNPVRLSTDTDQEYRERRAATFARMDYVIQRMQTVGCLTLQQGAQPFCVDTNVVRQAVVQKAQINAATFSPREVKFKYPHFVQFVTQYIESVYGSGEMYRRGFVIKTTLNSAIQDAAEAGLKQTMTTLINTGVNTGSVMVTDPRNGAVKAMVGSPNFNDNSIDGQVNGALTWQQPGSSIKPVEYAKALEGVDDNGDGRPDRWYTPATVLWDVPTTFQNPSYTPTNFDNRYHGPLALRYALQNSYNVPAVKTYQFIGDAGFKDMAARLGLSFPENGTFGLPTAIGATEVTLYGMMSAFGTFANSGVRVPLYVVDSITDSAGNVVDLPARAQPAQVIQPQIAYLMENILSDDTARATAFGVNGPLTISGIPTSGYVAAKTGTTNDARDLWTMGATTNTVVGVWLGRPDNAATQVRDGGYGSAAPLWNRVMTASLQVQGRPNAFPNPPGLIQAQICSDTGTLPPATCSSLRTELFVQGQEPPSADQAFVQQVAVDTWTGLRANEFCPDNRVTATVLNISDPTAVAWLNSPQGAADAQRLGIATGTVTTVPTDVCSVNTEVPIARVLSPTEGQTITTGPTQIFGNAAATQTFNRYQLEYASAAQPTIFTIIGGAVTTPQNSGVLATWNTQQLPNGAYILRLAMFSNSGGYLYRTVNVNIVNLVPTTPPQIIQPTSSIPLFITATPFGGVIDGSAQTSPGFATTAPLPFLPVVTPISP